MTYQELIEKLEHIKELQNKLHFELDYNNFECQQDILKTLDYLLENLGR